MQLDVKMREEN